MADPGELTVQQLRAEVGAIRWHHSIDLGRGVVTPGADNSPRKLGRLGLPASLAGRSVLDVGAWDGFFAFEAERRGAARVLATDSFIWGGSAPGVGKAGFDLAKRVLRSRVEEREIDVLDLSPEAVGTWDVVLFLGVLYHMRHPLLALERVASVTAGVAVVETVVDMLDTRRPAVAFYEDDRLARDASNWCGPNVPALTGMLRAAGFARVEVVAPPRSIAHRAAKAAHYRRTRGFRFMDTLRTDRVVVHAYK